MLGQQGGTLPMQPIRTPCAAGPAWRAPQEELSMKTRHCHTGLSLAVTVAVSYTICALLYRLWPEQGVAFLNALFHGLDFGRLKTPVPFGLADFLFPLAVLVVWGFVTGMVYSWVSHCLGRCCAGTPCAPANKD